MISQIHESWGEKKKKKKTCLSLRSSGTWGTREKDNGFSPVWGSYLFVPATVQLAPLLTHQSILL